MATQRTLLVSAVLVFVVSIFASAPCPARAAGPGGSEDDQEIQQAIELSRQQTIQVLHQINVTDPAPGASPGSDGQPAIQAQTQVLIQQGNPYPQVNPAPGKVNPALSGGQNAMEAIPPEMQAQLDQAQALLSNPALQKYLRIFSDADVQRDAQALIKSPQRMSFLMWEAGFVIFMLAFKTWLTLKSRKSFVAVIFVQLWTLALFIAGVGYVLPRCVFGPTYGQFVHSLWTAITR